VGCGSSLRRGGTCYWRNPGEAGLGSEVTFGGSGPSFGPLQWPAPAVLLSPGGSIVTYGVGETGALVFNRRHPGS
jgi:DsbC/DsbD-like thiol-disulfide interchange protein